MGKSKAAKVQVPECRYGAACTRKDCVFRHPPKKAAAQAPAKSDKVCFAFVAGKCVFGRQCRDNHPDEDSCRTIRERYQKIDCQWGRDCRTDGCLYQHPSDEQVGPALVVDPPKRQPTVFAEGPTIIPHFAGSGDELRKSREHQQVIIPKAVAQAEDLRDASAFEIPDPFERFFAVNARNTGTLSASLLDLHFQSPQTFVPLLDEALPERLHMFPQGVWILAGTGQQSTQRSQHHGVSLFDAVRDYLVRRRYDFAIGQGSEGQQRCAFLVQSSLNRRREDPLDGVKAAILCGLPGSGKSSVAETLLKKSSRYACVSQEDTRGAAACDEAFRQALAKKSCGSWWWNEAFSPETHYLAIPLRVAALTFLGQYSGIEIPRTGFVHATLAFQPTTLDLRAHLGRAYRVSFRCHVILEATVAQHTGEVVEAVMCTARSCDVGARGRAVPLFVALTPARALVRHMQVLNAVPADKRILANSTLGSFRIRQVVDLQGSADRLGLCLLMNKSGPAQDVPALVSFDAASVVGATGGARSCGNDWTEVGDAALASLDPLVVLEDVGGDSDDEWRALTAQRCETLGMVPPHIQICRPKGRAETKFEQWMRLHPRYLLHFAADEADVALWVRDGCAALRPCGGVALPRRSFEAVLPRVILLDTRSALTQEERRRWVHVGGLQLHEVVVVYVDVPEMECVHRVLQRGPRHQGTRAPSFSDVSAFVHSLSEKLEIPCEREGFREIIRLKAGGGGPAVSDAMLTAAGEGLVRRWEARGEREIPEFDQMVQQSDEDNEAAPPPLATLDQWIEAEGCARRVPLWGVQVGSPVDSTAVAMPEYPEVSQDCHLRGRVGWAKIPEEGGASVPPQRGRWAQEQLPGGCGNSRARGTAPSSTISVERRREGVVHEAEDEINTAQDEQQQEQLAAMLRCMGFDEEPSHQAALRAGGNLNLAVQAALQSREDALAQGG
eukprot:TRINITY_DN13314_c0_g1_i1.p1 TRINITY_DN13314_c0_g1~~TRINITY_DN13314_c0_g1_i1.p1  ORF type:complete len:954 (+),score=143.72 TRINITY_DN13314_c0_g1_i1:136-2997(+)